MPRRLRSSSTTATDNTPPGPGTAATAHSTATTQRRIGPDAKAPRRQDAQRRSTTAVPAGMARCFTLAARLDASRTFAPLRLCVDKLFFAMCGGLLALLLAS